MSNRVFYASHGVSVGGTTVQGAQSVGITTNFTLDPAFQLGQLALYDNVITTPEVEITVSKALDGQDSVWKLATGGGSLVANANDRCDVIVGVGDDTAPSLTNVAAIKCTGMYVSSVSYKFPVDGAFTEDVTFVGNSKILQGSVSAPSASGATMVRRQHFLASSSTLPVEVAGENISNVTITAQLGRESMYKLGQYAPFHRFVKFPLEVTCEIDVIATGIDPVELDLDAVTCTSNNLTPKQAIKFDLCDGTTNGVAYSFNLGDSNRLSSASFSGGDTGGGNVTIRYSYSTYNTLDISG